MKEHSSSIAGAESAAYRPILQQPLAAINGSDHRLSDDERPIEHAACEHVTFDLVGKSFSPSAVGVFNVSKYLPAEVGHVDGTIALDLFANYAFTLSYGGHFLELLDSKAISRRSSDLRVPIRLARTAEGLALTVDIPVKTPAGTAWFEVGSATQVPL